MCNKNLTDVCAHVYVSMCAYMFMCVHICKYMYVVYTCLLQMYVYICVAWRCMSVHIHVSVHK